MSYHLLIIFISFISLNPDHTPVSLDCRSRLPCFVGKKMRFMKVHWIVHSSQDVDAALLTQYQALPMIPAYETKYFCFRPRRGSFFSIYSFCGVNTILSAEGTQKLSWQIMSILYMYMDIINMFLQLVAIQSVFPCMLSVGNHSYHRRASKEVYSAPLNRWGNRLRDFTVTTPSRSRVAWLARTAYLCWTVANRMP